MGFPTHPLLSFVSISTEPQSSFRQTSMVRGKANKPNETTTAAKRGTFFAFPRNSDRSTPAEDSRLRQALTIAAIPFSSLCWVQKFAGKFVSPPPPPPKVKSGLGKRRFANPFLIVSVFFAEVFVFLPPSFFLEISGLLPPAKEGKRREGGERGRKTCSCFFRLSLRQLRGGASSLLLRSNEPISYPPFP